MRGDSHGSGHFFGRELRPYLRIPRKTRPFEAQNTPPRRGHLQAHQTAESDAAPRGKASPTITLHEPGAGGGGEDRQADI